MTAPRGTQIRYCDAHHKTAHRSHPAAHPTSGLAAESRTTGLGVAVLLAVLTTGALLSQSQTQASTGGRFSEASGRGEEPVAGQQASELFLEYLQTVIAKR